MNPTQWFKIEAMRIEVENHIKLLLAKFEAEAIAAAYAIRQIGRDLTVDNSGSSKSSSKTSRDIRSDGQDREWVLQRRRRSDSEERHRRGHRTSTARRPAGDRRHPPAYAQSLGEGVSAHAGKLSAAATHYERGDTAAAEAINFDPPEQRVNFRELETIQANRATTRSMSTNRSPPDAGLLDGPSSGMYREWLQRRRRQ